MTEADRIAEVQAQLREFQDLLELLPRMLTLIEEHVARLERLEYRVLGIQPPPPMTSARRDH